MFATPKVPGDYLSSGSTLLNLALSGAAKGGFLAGKYYYIVGDSDSGKTFTTMSCFAEATINPKFADYRLIHDNAEDGALMDMDHLFGEATADRIEPPEVRDGQPVFSTTIESFYFNVDNAIRDGRPFIYVLDSGDVLTSEASDAKFLKQKKAYEKDKEDDGEDDEKVAGSYGDGKAKKHSENLRRLLTPLGQSKSILIVIGQTRHNLKSRFGGKTRSGGEALAFYATTQIWSRIVERIEKRVRGKERDIGTRVGLALRRNRITGTKCDVEIDIYPSYGIDDIGSCIDFLTEEKFWPMAKETIEAEGLDISATREKLIRVIERDGLQDKLQEITERGWHEIEVARSLNRKPRYGTPEPTGDSD